MMSTFRIGAGTGFSRGHGRSSIAPLRQPAEVVRPPHPEHDLRVGVRRGPHGGRWAGRRRPGDIQGQARPGPPQGGDQASGSAAATA